MPAPTLAAQPSDTPALPSPICTPHRKACCRRLRFSTASSSEFSPEDTLTALMRSALFCFFCSTLRKRRAAFATIESTPASEPTELRRCPRRARPRESRLTPARRPAKEAASLAILVRSRGGLSRHLGGCCGRAGSIGFFPPKAAKVLRDEPGEPVTGDPVKGDPVTGDPAGSDAVKGDPWAKNPDGAEVDPSMDTSPSEPRRPGKVRDSGLAPAGVKKELPPAAGVGVPPRPKLKLRSWAGVPDGVAADTKEDESRAMSPRAPVMAVNVNRRCLFEL